MASDQPPTTLRDARIQAGMLQREVAAAVRDEGVRCSTSLVCMVEKGYEAKASVRGHIAQAVGASYGSFWGSA